MRVFVFFVIIGFMLESCTYSSNLTVVKNRFISKEEIIKFFDLNHQTDTLKNTILFYKNQDGDPFCWIAIGKEELRFAKKFNIGDCEVLILYNPSNTATNIFWKNGDKLSKCMLESKYYPDNIKFYKYINSIGILEFHFMHGFSEERHLYFFGAEQSLFETGITTSEMVPNAIFSTTNAIQVEMRSARRDTLIEIMKNGNAYKDLTIHDESLIIYTQKCLNFDSFILSKW